MRYFVRLFVLGLLLPLGSIAAVDLDDVVDRGLAALVRSQSADGSFGSSEGITALAGMALLSGGHMPTSGRYREASARTLNFILGAQDPMSGYLGRGMGNMYSHGFATLYLAETYGMSPDPRLRRALEAALDLTFRSQNEEGGWRYQPAPIDADISVTITQIMAIRAAYNLGIGGERAQQVISRAMAYVRSLATPEGTFLYRRGSGAWGTQDAQGVPRAAAGAMSILGAGIRDLEDPVLGPALAFLRRHFLDHLQGRGSWFWYGQYYTAQAKFYSPESDDWDNYWQAVVPILASYQDASGLWNRPADHGPIFGTAVALIILQIPNHYLPIFQR